MPPPKNNADLRIAIDTGGTFTDCVWVERGRVHLLKVFSTPKDPSQAIVEALGRIFESAPANRPRRPGPRPAPPQSLPALVLLHGTTVGTNTLLQRKGARVALVTTAGFEDAIEIGRQQRTKLYDFFFERQQPLVPSELRFGVAERTDSEGKILQAPSRGELKELADRVSQGKPQAIAISLLFSFCNPANETAIVKALEKLGLPLSVSHQILPEFREYERTSTVVVNACLQPVMQRYLESLARRTEQWLTREGEAQPVASRPRGAVRQARIFVMQSSGGITPLATAAREPVRTVLSGPAGGIVGAAAMARRSGVDRIISFDMGGTSTDVALVDREARTGTQSEVAGLPVGVPMLDIHTVGAGGGSVARFDAAGALRVGPESAGADPGPICYGRGTQPTVTDANLLLGRLPAHRFLGGEFTLDVERTRRVTTEWLKKQGPSFSLEQFAAGVIRVVNANMEKAIRVVSIERGYDPREFALVAFGGAGGMHACELADALSVPRVIVPALPGALSAFGILVSEVVKDYSRTVLWRASGKLPTAQLEKEFSDLEHHARQDFRDEGWPGKLVLQRGADVRYRGQGYELNVASTRRLLEDFHLEHQRRYGYSYPGREVELVTLRLRATVKSPQNRLGAGRVGTTEPALGSSPGRDGPEPSPVFFAGKKVTANIHARERLQPGRRYSGPAIVTEYSATTVVPPGMRFWLDRAGNLMIGVR